MTYATFRHTLFAFSLALFTMALAPVQEAQAQPANDDLAAAVEITAMPFSGAGSNVGATQETDEDGPGNSVWWKYTPTEEGLLTLDTFGSNYNTTLGVWTGSGHPLAPKAYNNDAGDGEQSELAVAVEADTTYYIRVAGGYYSPSEGEISLSASLGPPLPNDDLAEAIEIGSLPFSGTGSNAGATVEPDEAPPSYECARDDEIDNSVWWKYTSSQNGILTVDTGGSSFNNVVSVWTGTGHPLSQEACDRETSTSSNQATAKLAVSSGTTYYIRVAGMYAYGRPQEGDINLSVTLAPPIPHDDLADAAEIPSLPASINSSNYGATHEASEAIPSCEGNADKSVWWKYTPAQAGVLTADVDGSSLNNATVGLWSGSGHPLAEMGCADGYSATKVSAPVAAGETYYIRVSDAWTAGSPYEEGDISLSVALEPPLPNDDLADAVEIAALPFSGTGSNVGATGEADEATSGCDSDATNAVWWKYTPTQDGVLTVDADGTDFNFVLGLWTGGGHPLSEESCIEEYDGAAVVHAVAAGETYYIRVSGDYNNDEGDISLNVTLGPPLPNDDLADATEITALPFTGTGSNAGATQEAGEDLASCKDAEFEVNSVWWKYAATDYGSLTIDTGDSDFDTMFSVWTGDGHPLTSRGCTDSSEAEFINLEAGETYYIRITGYEGEEGAIGLSVTFSPPDPVYVDANATGLNNGTSWANAYTDLQDALQDGGTEIWVAEGTYSNGGTDFNLPSGRRVYGGFAGTETNRSARDWAQHETILTGTSNHVLRAQNVGGSTRLDGFTVSGGNANGTGDGVNGAGFYIYDGGSPTIRNVTFENNTADGDGGAIYLDCSSGRFCSPNLDNVVFKGNLAGGNGGAMYLNGTNNGGASPELSDVTFSSNEGTHGGAMYLDAESGTASPSLARVVFADNSATNGGAVYSWAGLQGTASPQFANVLFVNNTASAGGGAIHNSQAGGIGGWAMPSFTNVTFFGNSADQGHAIWNYGAGDGEATASLYNVIAWNNMNEGQTGGRFHNAGTATTGFIGAIIESASGVCYNNAVSCTGVLDEDPDFRADWNPDGPDNTYRTGDDGLRLLPYSPAIDAGDNLASTAASDLAGSPRVFGGAVDLGAYEHGVYQSESGDPGVGALTGFFKLGSTGATVLFTENASTSGGLSASRTDGMPSGSGLPDNVASRYWTITESLDGAFTYNVTFDLTDVGGISDFSALKVYKRPGDGQPWAAVDSLIRDSTNQTLTAANLTSFSQFTVGDESNALPVELAGFEAAPAGSGQVALTWQTLSEQGSAGFRIERKEAGTASAWAQLATVESRAPGGTSAEALSYRFTDEALPFEAQRLTYRLVQRDLDGTETVAGERAVEVGAPRSFTLHGSFPNPVRSRTTIRYELAAKRHVTLAVYDVLGRRVRTLADEEQSGRQEIVFEAGDLSSGVYFYRLTAGDYTETRRLVLVR